MLQLKMYVIDVYACMLVQTEAIIVHGRKSNLFRGTIYTLSCPEYHLPHGPKLWSRSVTTALLAILKYITLGKKDWHCIHLQAILACIIFC